MDMRTPLSRANHLGSAHEGAHHWWRQRMTGLALVPLLLWLVGSLVAMTGADYVTMRAWVARPDVTLGLVALLIALFYHAQLGLQVILEDYVHAEGLKLAALIAVRAACFLLGLLGVISVLRIAFGS
ncbi:MAG TPA: succinate dehydrogenase, hydrophobic membrane anchor protein [Candidatus Acidoferrales bacterium]|nr:succinate dehydrogenase, hydrophobic membrane anchor protein [Candidatus Acidoferrales bacterium]